MDNDVHDEWLLWMKHNHIPKVLATGLFINHRMLRLLNEEANGGTTYAIQYSMDSLQQFREYQSQFAPRLQEEVKHRYPNKFVAYRTLLEVVEA